MNVNNVNRMLITTLAFGSGNYRIPTVTGIKQCLKPAKHIFIPINALCLLHPNSCLLEKMVSGAHFTSQPVFQILHVIREIRGYKTLVKSCPIFEKFRSH